ncbi:MAG: VTT domain-containing protein [Pseudomonadota bacterium]
MRLNSQTAQRVAAALLLVGAMGAAVVFAPELEPGMVRDAVGRAGPPAIVLLVAFGIVVSPIPSGAVALVAGALYGTWWGGGLTILGAGLGSSGAFLLSRWLGRDGLAQSAWGLARFLTRSRSQNTLTLIVFATRLVPFVSFDAVSYIAGVTPIAYWRFLMATLLGTAPVCMAFAAAGHAQISPGHGDMPWILAFGITLVAPAVVGSWRLLQFLGRTFPALLGHRRAEADLAG